MKAKSTPDADLQAAEAFTEQSKIFDKLYGHDAIIQYKRQRVRDHMLACLPLGSKLLELNCGTGEDALYFAGKGFRVHATDLSAGMLRMLKAKKATEEMAARITTECCSFNQLGKLQDQGPYDHIYSNFGGFNCTGTLEKALHSLDPLLKPGGAVTLVIISKFCLWELLLLFRGRFKTAFRRFFSARGRMAHMEGRYFTCWYYSASDVKKFLGPGYSTLRLEGLCSLVPPSYLEGFAGKHPRLFRLLRRMENKYAGRWPWRRWGDYFIISLRKRMD